MFLNKFRQNNFPTNYG